MAAQWFNGARVSDVRIKLAAAALVTSALVACGGGTTDPSAAISSTSAASSITDDGTRRAATATALDAAPKSFVTREGSRLLLGGKPVRFAGTNMYWAGLDDNLRDATGQPTYPTHFRIDNAFDSAKKMNASLVRAHTLGISVGCARCIEPALGRFNDDAFESIDYAVAAAGQRNIRLMIPLTDQWNWYHGGKRTFTGWRGYSNDPNATAANSEAQKRSEANFYVDPVVIGDFKAYISHILNHVNRYTGVKLKDDPTIAIWETGNEIWDAPPAWTQQIAAHIKKTEGSQQLVADGSAATGMHVANAAVTQPDVDIVGGHFYPRDMAWMKQDAAVAAQNGKAYLVGEFPWTDDINALKQFLAAAEQDGNIAGDLYWTLLPQMEDGSFEPHGDGYTLHYPGDNDDMKQRVAVLGTHASAMSPPPAPPPAPPIAFNDDVFGYSAGWSVSNGSAKYQGDDHYSNVAGASAKASFAGTQIKIYSARAPHHGVMSVRIDAGAVTLVDLYSATRQDQSLVYTSAALAAGTHTVEVKVTGSKNSSSSNTVVALDKIEVSGGSASPPPPPPPPPPSASITASFNDGLFTYSWGWWVSNGSAKYDQDDHYTNAADATATASFTGTQLKIHGARASHHGVMAVRIDSGAETLVDLYSAERQDQALLYSSAVLAEGPHQVEVRATGSKNPSSSNTVVALDKVEVQGASPSFNGATPP